MVTTSPEPKVDVQYQDMLSSLVWMAPKSFYTQPYQKLKIRSLF